MKKFLLKEWDEYRESENFWKIERREDLKRDPDVFKNNRWWNGFKFMSNEAVRVSTLEVKE